MKWFKDWGGMYLPISWQGTVITGLAILFCVHIFIAIDRNSHSNSDTLYGIFPYVVPTIIVWYLIAWKTSRGK